MKVLCLKNILLVLPTTVVVAWNVLDISVKEHTNKKGQRRNLSTGDKPPSSLPPVTEFDCSPISITLYRDDIPDYFVEFSSGSGLKGLPFFNSQTGEQLGIYSDASIRYDNDECVGTGTFSFDPIDDQGLYATQVMTAFSCNGVTNTITGGTGDYGCATGYQTFKEVDETTIQTELYICGAKC